MKNLRKILWPFSLIYGLIVEIRNWAFDKGWMSSTLFSTPTIVVGNLNMGGTGKTPQIEYLIRLFEKTYQIAVLSRGYKRATKGFQLADQHSTATQIGDEPLQFYRKFSNCMVAVDVDRSNGIRTLDQMMPSPDLILLDDAFQHRKVKGGYNILLTTYGDLYVDDYILPAGNLRENKRGANRADMIVVSKCPEDLTEVEQKEITRKLKITKNQQLYFSSIEYDEHIVNVKDKISLKKLIEYKVILVTGVANSKPLTDYLLEHDISFQHLNFPDHHDFSTANRKKMNQYFHKLDSDKKIILTTEKDFVRNFLEDDGQIYYLPIRTKILWKEQVFNKQVLNYVRSNSRNS